MVEIVVLKVEISPSDLQRMRMVRMMVSPGVGQTLCVSHYSELLLGTSGSENLPPCHDANSRKSSPLSRGG